MQISYADNNQNMLKAVEFVNQLTSNEEFWIDINNNSGFDDTNLRPYEIGRRLRACITAVKVKHWTPKPPPNKPDRYKKTVAVTDPNRPYTIFYHTKFLGNSVAAMVNTLVHEFVHNVDKFDDGSSDLEYTHATQTARGNQGTAPYWIGDRAQGYYDLAQEGVPILETKAKSYAVEQEFECELVKVADDEIE